MFRKHEGLSKPKSSPKRKKVSRKQKTFKSHDVAEKHTTSKSNDVAEKLKASKSQDVADKRKTSKSHDVAEKHKTSKSHDVAKKHKPFKSHNVAKKHKAFKSHDVAKKHETLKSHDVAKKKHKAFNDVAKKHKSFYSYYDRPCIQLFLTPETNFFAPPPGSNDIDNSNICSKCLRPISDENAVKSVISEDHPWYSYISVKTIIQEDPEVAETSKDVCSEGLGSSSNQSNVLSREATCSSATPLSSNHNDSIHVEIPLYKINIDHLLMPPPQRFEAHCSKDVTFMPKKISDVNK